ncbi:PilZ domain-containing protein [Methylobacterium longum]|uniref:PilZ domain-containing protein n=1 Tax=Methylobacterium longum TaxID=767694 RepID=A0ABT8AXI0_9HYPH|nr:PilZ domain-containing protein [Methylobacterium longum]MDN3574270.1 hypothetical protein [Methylobacterium longum]GJE13402.1 hypothetical protein FOHLNKBM_4465 [Methylobacterium longum]
MDPEQVAGQTNRREERREMSWIAIIRLPDGSEIPTTVKDVSSSGARLTVPSSYVLPERFVFKVLERDFVCGVQLAWRRDAVEGLRLAIFEHGCASPNADRVGVSVRGERI